MAETERSLDVQRGEFATRRFLAMPLAGTIAWLVVAAGGWLAPRSAWLILFMATGSIAYLGIGLSKHWVGIFHGASRTVLIVAAHCLLPQHRYIVIPLVIVAIYAVTIVVLERRWRRVRASESPSF